MRRSVTDKYHLLSILQTTAHQEVGFFLFLKMTFHTHNPASRKHLDRSLK